MDSQKKNEELNAFQEANEAAKKRMLRMNEAFSRALSGSFAGKQSTHKKQTTRVSEEKKSCCVN